MGTVHESLRTYVEPSAGSAGVPPAPSPEAAYRARHVRLHRAGNCERLVREGGMGAVLEVRGEVLDLGPGRYALKLIKERLLGEPEVAARFRRELASHRRLSASFQVPRLVPCLAFSDHEDPDLVFGVFPFYSDGTLEEALSQGLSVSEALWILADAVEGLQSLHGLGYVHRDFHPSNILVDREGGRRRGVLGDLGVGLFMQSNTIFTETQLGVDRRRQVGHRGYIDPVFRAAPQSDLYAVGATLYRILTGRLPVGNRFPKSGALTLPADLSGLEQASGVHEVATSVLFRLTAPDESDRFASAREARVDLVALAERVQHCEPERVAAPLVRVRTAPRRRVGRRLGWAAAIAALAISSSAYGVWTWRAEELPVQETLTPVSSPGPSPLPPKNPHPDPLPPLHTLPSGEGATTPPQPLMVGARGTGGGALSREDVKGGPGEGQGEGPRTVDARGTGGDAPLPGRVRSVGGRGDGGEGLLAPATEVLRIDPLLRQRRYQQAEARSRELWARYPADPEVAGRLALIVQLTHGDEGVREAKTVLSAALERHPGRGDLRLALARVLMQLDSSSSVRQLLADAPLAGTHIEEIEALRRTLERSPQ